MSETSITFTLATFLYRLRFMLLSLLLLTLLNTALLF